MVSEVLTATSTCCECRIRAGQGLGLTPGVTTQPLLSVTRRQQHSLIEEQEEGEVPAKRSTAGGEAQLSLCALLLPSSQQWLWGDACPGWNKLCMHSRAWAGTTGALPPSLPLVQGSWQGQGAIPAHPAAVLDAGTNA